MHLVRSRIGARSEAQETFDSLNLRRVGHCRVLGGKPRVVRGYIRKLRPWINAYPLTLRGHSILNRIGVEYRMTQDTPTRRLREYDAEGASGSFLDLSSPASRDFVHVESNDEGLAIAWSTALPLASILELLRFNLKDDGTFRQAAAQVYDWSVQRHRRGTAGILLDDVQRAWRPYRAASLELTKLRFVWSSPAFPRHVEERVRSGEIRMMLDHPASSNDAFIGKLMAQTATPAIGKELEATTIRSMISVTSSGSAATLEDRAAASR